MQEWKRNNAIQWWGQIIMLRRGYTACSGMHVTAATYSSSRPILEISGEGLHSSGCLRWRGNVGPARVKHGKHPGTPII